MSVQRHLFFTDPHFTDREQDSYRWKVFPFLKEVESRFGQIDHLWCLGDLTEFKDCHSSRLLHRIVDELHHAPGMFKHVVKGNHDYIEEGEPFFDWLGELNWGGYGIAYYSEPEMVGSILVLPHTNNPEAEWAKFRERDADIQLVLAHLTVNGCQSEMGQILPGISRTAIPGSRALVLSGDIHKPQHIGPDFIYVGTPYSTRFSPAYEPRVLMLEMDFAAPEFNPRVTSIPTGLKRKITTTIHPTAWGEVLRGLPSVYSLGPEDELRVTVPIPLHTTPAQWKELKEEMLANCVGLSVSVVPQMERVDSPTPEAEEAGVGVQSRPEDAFSEYCQATAIPEDLRDVGSTLLRSRLSKT